MREVVEQAVDGEEQHAGDEHRAAAGRIHQVSHERPHEERCEAGHADERADLPLVAPQLLDEEGKRGEVEQVEAEEDEVEHGDAHHRAREEPRPSARVDLCLRPLRGVPGNGHSAALPAYAGQVHGFAAS
ncbi:MAG: hypothetical protein L6Q80_14690 [Dehalococcoidia bacterium]|nr:hypothetical protein [Dehalococcoidia bacterium]